MHTDMTTIDGPGDPLHLDEKSVRDELTRVFDVCHGCRRCLDFCSSFSTLFDLIDRLADHDAGRLTPSQQDRVVDGCHQCKACVVVCPYAPDRDERNVDVPRQMARAVAMRQVTGQTSFRRRVATAVLGRPDLLGRRATSRWSSAGWVIRRIARSAPGSRVRRLVAAVVGVSSARLLPQYADQRFSDWFVERPGPPRAANRGSVTVFPTCIVEYQQTQIGKDLIGVYERNGIACSVTAVGCCGAPWLYAGDIERFTEIAETNVRTLAVEVGQGDDIVVAQPSCRQVLRQEYVAHVGGSGAELVAAHTHDAVEYLANARQLDGAALDTDFDGSVPERVVYHDAGHLREPGIGAPGIDLIGLTGADVTVVRQGWGMDGAWGLRAENDVIATSIAERLGQQVVQACGERPGLTIVGDCCLANTAIAEQAGCAPVHPLQVLARAYGIAADD
jgi:Fe-S oxidoreductase